MNQMYVCSACLQLCESNASVDITFKQLYAAITRLPVTEATQIHLCHYCKWLVKKSYAFIEKCRVAHAILKQCGNSDCPSIIDIDLLKQQDVYQHNQRLFMANLGNSETINSEYPEVEQTKPEGTVAFVKVEDILKAKTRDNISAPLQEDDQNNEADKWKDGVPETNSTEFLSLNEERANNEICFEEKNLNYEFEGDNVNEYYPNNLESDLDTDIPNEKKIVITSKIDSNQTKAKSLKKSKQTIKRKKKIREANCGFESLCLSIETQREDLKSRRKDSRYLNSKFRCHNCALGFVHENSYKMHMSRLVLYPMCSNGKNRCEICTLRFATRSGFCMHRAVHRQRFRCYLCLEVVKKCQFHRARCRVKMAADVTVKCSVCGKEFGDGKSMERHTRRQHTDPNRQTFQCEQCDKTFSYLHTLRSHLLVHETTSNHTCGLCDRTFVTRKQLTDHKRSHTEITGSYYCAACDVTLKNAKSLRAHYVRSSKHASPEQYTHKCVSCDATYTNARDLRAHAERNHSTEAKYSCVACNATYTCGQTLNDHCRRVHGTRNTNQSFVCEFCGKAFKAKSVLQKHIEMHSSERLEISKLEFAEPNTEKNETSRIAYTNVSIKELNVMDAI